jgi:hypothetical protein
LWEWTTIGLALTTEIQLHICVPFGLTWDHQRIFLLLLLLMMLLLLLCDEGGCSASQRDAGDARARVAAEFQFGHCIPQCTRRRSSCIRNPAKKQDCASKN